VFANDQGKKVLIILEDVFSILHTLTPESLSNTVGCIQGRIKGTVGFLLEKGR